MPILYARDTVGLGRTPVQRVNRTTYGGRMRRYSAVLRLGATTTNNADGNDTIAATTADQVLLARAPAGSVFGGGRITSSVSLGTAVIAIGTSVVHASNGQFRAAGTFTAVDTPTVFGSAAALAQAPYTSDTDIWLTIATANLPTSGTVVIDLEFIQP